MGSRATVKKRDLDGDRALGIGGFMLSLAFWCFFVTSAHLLEDSRSVWWMVGLISLVLSLPALLLALCARRGWMLGLWGVGTAAVLALAALPWHPRKAFLENLEALTPGTPIAVAQARMARYVENGEVAVDRRLDVPVAAAVPPLEGSITYRWNTADPRYNADLGIVEYADGRVSKVSFSPD